MFNFHFSFITYALRELLFGGDVIIGGFLAGLYCDSIILPLKGIQFRQLMCWKIVISPGSYQTFRAGVLFGMLSIGHAL